MNLPRVKLSIGDREIDAYVARSAEERALGLMHRREMPWDEGMLFMCDEPCVQRFWMKDTPLALSVAFLEDDGTIVHLVDMEPHSLDAHCCEQPVRFILEVNQGWFAEHGVHAGDRLVGPTFLAAQER